MKKKNQTAHSDERQLMVIFDCRFCGTTLQAEYHRVSDVTHEHWKHCRLFQDAPMFGDRQERLSFRGQA